MKRHQRVFEIEEGVEPRAELLAKGGTDHGRRDAVLLDQKLADLSVARRREAQPKALLRRPIDEPPLTEDVAERRHAGRAVDGDHLAARQVDPVTLAGGRAKDLGQANEPGDSGSKERAEHVSERGFRKATRDSHLVFLPSDPFGGQVSVRRQRPAAHQTVRP